LSDFSYGGDMDIHDEIADCEQAIWEKGQREVTARREREREKKMDRYIVVADPTDNSLGAFSTARVVHPTLESAIKAASVLSKKNHGAYYVARLTHKIELVQTQVTEL